MPALPILKARIARKAPVNVVLYGDSISEVGRSPRWFGGATAPEHNWGRVLGRLLGEHHPTSAFHVHHFGIGGQNTYEGYGRMDYLLPFNPHLVLVAFGANDCGHTILQPEESAQALRLMVGAIHARTGADVVVVGSGGENPIDARWKVDCDTTIAAMRDAAHDVGVTWSSTRAAVLKATENGARWTDFHNGEHNCHPNDAGHILWAQTALTAIEAALAETP